MIDRKNVFDQPVKRYKITYQNIRKLLLSKDDYTAVCLLNYHYFKEHCKITAIDLSKQQALDADPRAIQQINFTENLNRDGNTKIFFIIEEEKETILDF